MTSPIFSLDCKQAQQVSCSSCGLIQPLQMLHSVCCEEKWLTCGFCPVMSFTGSARSTTTCGCQSGP